MPRQEKSAEATRKELLVTMTRRPPGEVEEMELPFGNDDVPKFLSKLDAFEAASRKSRLEVT